MLACWPLFLLCPSMTASPALLSSLSYHSKSPLNEILQVSGPYSAWTSWAQLGAPTRPTRWAKGSPFLVIILKLHQKHARHWFYHFPSCDQILGQGSLPGNKGSPRDCVLFFFLCCLLHRAVRKSRSETDPSHDPISARLGNEWRNEWMDDNSAHKPGERQDKAEQGDILELGLAMFTHYHTFLEGSRKSYIYFFGMKQIIWKVTVVDVLVLSKYLLSALCAEYTSQTHGRRLGRVTWLALTNGSWVELTVWPYWPEDLRCIAYVCSCFHAVSIGHEKSSFQELQELKIHGTDLNPSPAEPQLTCRPVNEN